MNYKRLLNTSLNRTGVPKMFAVSISGKEYTESFNLINEESGNFIFENGELRLEASFEEAQNGVVIRRDKVTNISEKKLTLSKLSSAFELEGDDYNIYTQFNCGAMESKGEWARLNTRIIAESAGIRSCDSATPIMAFEDAVNQKITVFHLVPNCKWKLEAKKSQGEWIYVKVRCEAGFSQEGLAFELESGEEVCLPEIVFFEADSKLSLDSYKLHDVWNSLYPRRKMPVMYNTWFLKFDKIDVDNVLRQVKAAAELGIEQFMIDAGWFGKGGNWDECIGDWRENTVGGFKGRVKEVSDYARSLGMSFGMWLEPERALKNTPINKEHPEFFIAGSFLDFSNPDALDYITELTCSLIETYNLGFMKFDFNDTIPYDPKNCGFYKYYAGQKKYVRAVKQRFPELYLTNCASGGQRIDLDNAKLFDSFWLSDNQGPLEGNDIYCGHIMRMPPSAIEKWNVITFCEGIPEYGNEKLRTLPISCNDAVWNNLVYVKENYTFGFSGGSPLGFSCDIASFPKDFKLRLREFIEKYKAERSFYISANARLLCNTDSIKVLQYSSISLDRLVIYCFSRLTKRDKLTVYPAADPCRSYCVDGNVMSGAELIKNGITFGTIFDHECLVKEIYAV